jgi:hypothetical protein
MIFLLLGVWLIGASICFTLFYDRDDGAWGLLIPGLWPIFLLAGIAGMFLSLCRQAYCFCFGDDPTFPEDPHG